MAVAFVRAVPQRAARVDLLPSPPATFLGVTLRPTQEPSVPDGVEDASLACVEYVRRALGLELDFSPETLPILDHYLARSIEITEKEEILDLVVRSAGAYFGEVVRRALGGARWHFPLDEPTACRIEFEHVFLCFNPLGMAREAIAAADQPGWNAHLEVLPRDRPLLEQSLARMGEIREDDYHRLAVRFEVIEQVVATLEAAAISRGAHDERFAPPVYEEAARASRDAQAAGAREDDA